MSWNYGVDHCIQKFKLIIVKPFTKLVAYFYIKCLHLLVFLSDVPVCNKTIYCDFKYDLKFNFVITIVIIISLVIFTTNQAWIMAYY